MVTKDKKLMETDFRFRDGTRHIVRLWQIVGGFAVTEHERPRGEAVARREYASHEMGLADDDFNRTWENRVMMARKEVATNDE